MIRSIFNLLLVLAICFTASMIPLDAAIFDTPLDGNAPNERSITSEYAVLTAEGDADLVDPTQIEFTIKGIFNKDFSDDFIRIEFLQNGEVLKTLPASDFDFERDASSEDGLSLLAYKGQIDQDTAGLSDGAYTLRIFIEDETAIAMEEGFANIYFYPQGKFSPAASLATRVGQTNFRLYFPDNEYMYLVPVTRAVPEQGGLVRLLVNTLSEGPKASMGLTDGSPIPPVPYIWISGNTATVSLPKGDLGIYDDGSSVSLFAANALVYTLRDNLGIENVQVLINQQPALTALHGLDISTPWKAEAGPRVYIGLETGSGRLVLAPARLQADSYEDAIEQMFRAFRTGIVNDVKSPNAVSILPAEVTVVDYKISAGVLTMDLSADVTKLYGNRTDLAHMAVEALLNSLTTLQNVEKVVLTAKGVPIQFESYDFSAPLEKPVFINPES